jgi:hypothetical protein
MAKLKYKIQHFFHSYLYSTTIAQPEIGLRTFINNVWHNECGQGKITMFVPNEDNCTYLLEGNFRTKKAFKGIVSRD